MKKIVAAMALLMASVVFAAEMPKTVIHVVTIKWKDGTTEEQKAKAAKAADRKADREKAVNEERVKSIGAGSKKIAVRGKKGKKRM